MLKEHKCIYTVRTVQEDGAVEMEVTKPISKRELGEALSEYWMNPPFRRVREVTITRVQYTDEVVEN